MCLNFSVGVALGGSTYSYYGWTPNQELRYTYTSEVLSGIPDIKFNQFSGVKLQAEVIIQTQRDYTLRIRFANTRALVINSEEVPVIHGKPVLPPATQELPEWFKTPLEKPFEAHLRRGVIEQTYYESSTPVEVLNIQKGLLSQLQMDLTGSGRGFLAENTFVTGGDPTRVPPLSPEEQTFFSTLESTVDGECQTDYTFTPIPKFQSYNINFGEKVKEKELVQEGLYVEGKTVKTGEEICEGKQYYQVVKTRNYNNCVRRPFFQMTVGLHHSCDFSKGDCPDLMAHISTTRYLICGQREQFYIREIYTESDVTTNPFGWNTTPEQNKQMARVMLTIQEVKTSGFTPMPKPGSPIKKETLTYEFPVGHHEAIPEKKLSGEEIVNPGNMSYIHPIRRMPDLRSVSNILPSQVPFEDLTHQFVPELIKVVRIFFKVNEDDTCKKDISGILSMLSYNLRPLSYEQIKQLEKIVLSASIPSGIKKELVLAIFYDVVAMSGSNPALIVIKDVVENTSTSTISVQIKSRIILTALRSSFTPTHELMNEMFEMIKKFETNKEYLSVYTNGLIGLTNMVYSACINPLTSVSSYPVRIYGRFCSPESSFVTDELIPYLARQLKSHESDPHQIKKLIFISALGKIGHKKALIPIVQVIDNSTFQSPMTRTLAVQSLKRIARQEPTLTRRILLALIDNPAEATEVRIAAVSVLPYSQPSVTDLQKIAVRSWFEPSKQVGAFVYSTMKHLVNTEQPELKIVGEKVKTLLHLVRPFQTGLEFSQNIQLDNYVRYLLTSATGGISYITGDRNIIPTRVSVTNNLFGSSWKFEGLSFTAYTNGMNQLWNKILSSSESYKVSSQSQEKLEKIDRELGIVKEALQTKAHAFLQVKTAGYETMYPYSSKDIAQVLDKIMEVIKAPIGSHVGEVKELDFINVYPYITIDALGATQTGFPMYMRRSVPVVYGIRGKYEMNSKYGQRTEITTKAVPVFHSKAIGVFGVIVPFTKQVAGASVELSFYATLPFATHMVLDKHQGKADVSIKMIEDTSMVTPGNFETFHIYTKPATFIQNLKQLLPFGQASNLKVIYSGEPKKHFNYPVGQSIGLQSNFIVNSDYKRIDIPAVIETLRQHNLASLLTLSSMVPSVRQNSIKLTLNTASSQVKELHTSFTFGKTSFNLIVQY